MATTTRLLTAVAGIGAALCLAGCGGSAAPGNSSQKSNDAQALRFAQCMREHGVQMSDPGSGGQGNGFFIQGGGPNGSGPNSNLTTAQLQQAQQACQKYLPTGGNGPGQLDQKRKDALLKFTQCLREHGVNVPDPQFDSNGNALIAPQGPGSAPDPNSPTFQNARQACQHFLSDAGMNPPGGASGGGTTTGNR